jgi:hypothetical protein
MHVLCSIPLLITILAPNDPLLSADVGINTGSPLTLSTPTVRCRPEPIIGNTTEGNVHFIPTQIRKIMEAGWNQHIPLTYLTDEYCQNPNRSTALCETITFEDGQLSIQRGQDLHNPDERSLSILQWMQAISRLLGLINNSLPNILGSPRQSDYELGRTRCQLECLVAVQYCRMQARPSRADRPLSAAHRHLNSVPSRHAGRNHK